ncbi:MAG: hypothetical protein ACRDGL_06585 [Candidatus Limnocylindrales bacterium]
MSGEAPRPYEELAAQADAALDAAAAAGAAVRVMGGIAVRMRAVDLGQIDPARRVYHDIDLVGRLRDVRAIDAAIAGLGYEPDRAINAQFGTVRRVYYHPSGFHIDLFFERLEFCHTIDLAGRLDRVPRTTSPADLLLQKLQIVERNEKDVIDVFWLLLNHELGAGDPAGIELDRVVSLTSGDWGLYTTATDFLGHARQLVGTEHLSEAAKGVVTGRLSVLQAAIETAPKSGRWAARARLGRRVRWYRAVEEVL